MSEEDNDDNEGNVANAIADLEAARSSAEHTLRGLISVRHRKEATQDLKL